MSKVLEDLDKGCLGYLFNADHFFIETDLVKEPQNGDLSISFCVSIILLKVVDKLDDFRFEISEVYRVFLFGGVFFEFESEGREEVGVVFEFEDDVDELVIVRGKEEFGKGIGFRGVGRFVVFLFVFDIGFFHVHWVRGI